MIYADYNGSTPIDKNVLDFLMSRLQNGIFANPNAIHARGRKLHLNLEKARRMSASELGSSPQQIIFNSGATEGINHVFHSLFNEKPEGIIISSKLEHSAVAANLKHYQTRGMEIKYLNVLSTGQLDLDQLNDLLIENKNKCKLVCLMAANNETGIIYPYDQIAKICQKHQVPFFSDTTQYIGKAPFHFEQSGMDFAVLSSHKIGSIIGSGILLCKNPISLKPQILGGGQENNFRSGTQNYLGIECMAMALTQINHHLSKSEMMRAAKEKMEQQLKNTFADFKVIGEELPRLSTTSLLAFKGLHGQSIQIELESKNIFVTTSSACADNEPETSKVLKAMGINDDIGRSVIRVSIGLTNQPEDYEQIGQQLETIYKKLKLLN